MWGTAIYWKFRKMFIMNTSSNHAEMVNIHEASQSVLLRSIIYLIQEKDDLKYDKISAIISFRSIETEIHKLGLSIIEKVISSNCWFTGTTSVIRGISMD